MSLGLSVSNLLGWKEVGVDDGVLVGELVTGLFVGDLIG